MAEENIHKQEFVIRDLLTRSVTLSPSRAQIIRDIDDVSLKVGINEITIYGLTPTADESSIKVDGKGSATISDLTVELVTNRERYEDIYPSESDSSDTDEDPAGLKTENERARDLAKEVEKIRDLIGEATEDRDSAADYLGMMSEYGKNVTTCPANDLLEHMKAYREARKNAFDVKTAGDKKIKGLEDQLARLLKENSHITKASEREKKAMEKAKSKLRAKRQLAAQEKARAKARLREERSKFWPRKVYRVVLTLDPNWGLTPGSSRRGSIDSPTKSAIRAPPSTSIPGSSSVQNSSQISLSLSYITHSASWSPRYDLNLSTPGRSGTITYHAEFSNQTSESWRDAKVILSTSQTTFQSLSEPIPILHPWQIRLSKLGSSNNGDEALVSQDELRSKHKGGDSAFQKSKEPRHALFGADNDIPQMPNEAWAPGYQLFGTSGQPQAIRRRRRLMQEQVQHQNQVQQQSQQQYLQQLQQQVQQQRPSAPPLPPARRRMHSASQGDPSRSRGSGNGGVNLILESEDSDPDAETITHDDPIMRFEESTWEETGLTATYDVPGLRTIPPSDTTRRHKIASVALHDVRLSYILIPKLREAAFLQARLRNSSSITLLRGPAGLTLDGSFLGNITLPRCSAGQPFHLNLGVDPAVRVVYQKPAVHHRQSGLFQKEGNGVYTRAVTLTNTKSNAAVEGVVLDQIPVSEDERLRVEILQPRGLRVEGDRVNCGTALGGPVGGGNGSGATRAAAGGVKVVEPVRDEKSSKAPAAAVLKKGGEVCWDFKLGMSKAMRLVLEYETRFPSGEKVV